MSQSTRFPVPASGYRGVCFDLDGTLLPQELEEFLSSYYGQLGRFMMSRGANGEFFKTALNNGILAMIANEGDATNAEAFWSTFFSELERQHAEAGEENRSNEEWEALFTEFYEGPFGEIGKNVVPDENMVRAVHMLREKGYPLVLTTMPLFPIQALRWRCEWAGLDASYFSRLTTFENSTAAKPRLHYYAENLAALGLAGSDVLMVGNNTVEDLAFVHLGADAYLVTNHILDPIDLDLSTVRHGTSQEFAAWVDGLPICENPVQDIVSGLVDNDATEMAYADNLHATPEELAAAKKAARVARAVNEEAGGAIADASSSKVDEYRHVGLDQALSAEFPALESEDN